MKKIEKYKNKIIKKIYKKYNINQSDKIICDLITSLVNKNNETIIEFLDENITQDQINNTEILNILNKYNLNTNFIENLLKCDTNKIKIYNTISDYDFINDLISLDNKLNFSAEFLNGIIKLNKNNIDDIAKLYNSLSSFDDNYIMNNIPESEYFNSYVQLLENAKELSKPYFNLIFNIICNNYENIEYINNLLNCKELINSKYYYFVLEKLSAVNNDCISSFVDIVTDEDNITSNYFKYIVNFIVNIKDPDEMDMYGNVIYELSIIPDNYCKYIIDKLFSIDISKLEAFTEIVNNTELIKSVNYINIINYAYNLPLNELIKYKKYIERELDFADKFINIFSTFKNIKSISDKTRVVKLLRENIANNDYKIKADIINNLIEDISSEKVLKLK